MHWVHMVNVVHIDRHGSRDGNFHRNLYNMRYHRHILFLAARAALTPFIVHIIHIVHRTLARNVTSSWHARLAWTQHHSCFSRDHCECHWLKP